MSPVDAVLRDLAGVEQVRLLISPNRDLNAVSLIIAGPEMRQELLIDPSASLDLAIALAGAVSRLLGDE